MLIERFVFWFKIKNEDGRKHRILFISGVLPNVDDFAKLITGDTTNKVQINWRPLDEPQIGELKWDGVKWLPNGDPTPFTKADCQNNGQFEEIVVRTAITFAYRGSTMVFSASKQAIMSDSLINLLKCLLSDRPFGTILLPPNLSRRTRWQSYYDLLEIGVAIHHGDLPADLRRVIESYIYNGKIKLLFASPTLAQGVNIPLKTVLTYRLQHGQHGYGTRISDATFWNVVGRVGRPISVEQGEAIDISSPEVLFLINKSQSLSTEDCQDERISRCLQRDRHKYRVENPYLEFLSHMRKRWTDDTGKSLSEMVSDLSERTDLQWVKSDDRKLLAKCLRLLDEHLTAFIQEAHLT